MKNIFYITAIMVVLITACVSKNKPILKNDMEKYTNEWAEIEALRKQGLPKSLLPKVDTIYKSAMAEQNYAQAIKAIIYQINSIGVLEENDEGVNRIFNNLKKDAETIPQPAKSILYSMIGQMYEEFYNQNSRTINRRTSTATELDDVMTWDARKLAEEAVKYYNLSLLETEKLQNEPLDNYKSIIWEGNNLGYKPSLYDMLANRALTYYSSNFNVHSLPQQVFVVNNTDYFADAQAFSKMKIETEDTLSAAYLSLKIYQELLRFHLKKSGFDSLSGDANEDVNVLINTDLSRMSYLRDNGRYTDNEKMFETALVNMSSQYRPYSQNARILLELGRYYKNQGDAWRNDKKEEKKSGYSKAFEICERIEKEYPNQEKSNVEALKNNVLYKEMDMKTESVQLPGQPFQALLKFRNLDAVHKTVYKLNEKEALNFVKNNYKYRDDELTKFIKTLKNSPVQELIKLPSVTDFQYYTTEIGIAPLDEGFYLVVLSDTDDPANSSDVYTTSLVQVSALMAQERTIDVNMTVLVTNRKTGEPLSGAKITTYRGDKKYQTFTSDNDGMARSGEMEEYYNIGYYRVEYKNRQLLVINPGYGVRTYKRDEYNAAIFTDRSIYRPGQTVYFKAVLYKRLIDKERELVKGKTINVRFRDVNYQTISEQKLTTNEFGSIDGNLSIPQGLLNGNMTIEFDEYGSTSVRVEEYKRPTFEMKFDPVEGNFALNEKVKVTGIAKALAGYAIDNATVQYRVKRSSRYRFYYWWLPRVDDTREISSGVLKTDDKGNVTIEFVALADDVKDDQKIYTYTVTAEVTDVNGETRGAYTDVFIGSKPLLVNTNMPENLLPGKLEGFTVETTNLNGDATPASVEVEIIALKSPAKILRKRAWSETIDLFTIPEDEFRRLFPFDAYGDELNPDKLKVAETVAKYKLETPENKNLDLSSMSRSGYYKVRLTADNKKGVVVSNELYVYLNGEKPEPIISMDKWLTITKNSGEPGEQIELMVAGGEENSYVYCEVIFNTRINESKWIKTGTTPTKITFPIKEEYRGGFEVQVNMIQHNRLYSSTMLAAVPFTNKMLDVKLATYRDKLLPGENETWTMQVSNKKGEKETAEIVAALYDASLDALNPHSWGHESRIYNQSIYQHQYFYQWENSVIGQMATKSQVNNISLYQGTSRVMYANIIWFGATYRQAFYANASSYSGMSVRGMTLSRNVVASAPASTREDMDMDMEKVVVVGYGTQKKKELTGAVSVNDPDMNISQKPDSPEITMQGKQQPDMDLTAIETRTNFNETAFFYPKLRTNEKGEVLIEFTMPEALTRWKLLSFAHTKDFKVGGYTNELITQKQIAISANSPRFFRENDIIEFTAKVNNLTENDLNGQALLRLYDAVTMEPVDAIIKSEKTQSFNVKTGGSVGLKWQLVIPAGIQAITYKVTAQAGTHSDGEEKTVPVLTNSMLVTETLPFSVRAGKEKTFTFDKLVNNKSNTLRNHSLTLEYTSAPAWYAVQALPYIMEYPYECAEQTFSRYYANTLATTVVNKTPRIKQIFDLWNSQNSEALMSNLEKNQELKQVMLEETPWVMQAKNETERKKRIGLLFDLNRMSNEMNRAFNKLKKIQNSDGGFPWFDGNPSSRYITQHIVAGMAHLEKLGAMQEKNSTDASAIVQKGLPYLDSKIREDYKELLDRKVDMEKMQIGSIQLHYLYACSFSDHKPSGKQKEAYDFYLAQTGKFWLQFSTYNKAMAALVLHRNNQTETAMAIIRSLKEYSQQSEEMGMSWKDNVAGYFWYQAPIETQAILIEAFNEVAADSEAVEEMKIWLLRNKQTNDWKTTKATSEAIYALLMTGGNLLDESKLLEVEIAGKPLAQVAKEEIKPEPGTGYVKTSWQGSDIIPQMGNLKVKNPNQKGIAWGGMYWQYFEQLDKITSAETNLRMNKQLFLRTLTDKGEQLQPINENNKLKVGDLVRVRMELRADRDYEYVHLKDMRASGFEPVSTVSGHRYQDGLWYYESIKDASTNFFITYLRKGTYVFEYDLRVSHAGDFSNGITTFQCMYAPEFSSHSEGIRVKVE
jgi:Large extracellular alpha-helical protein